MVQIIKAYLDLGRSGMKSEIRRFTLDDDCSLNFKFLCEKISSIFFASQRTDFSVHWKDAEGDYITMSTDEELNHALSNVEDGIFRVYIMSPNTRKDPTEPNSEQSGVLHENVVCDGCNGEIRKYRYKCLQCSDFDLCDKCHAQDAHPAHDMVKITSPVPHQWLFPGWRHLYSHIFGRPSQGICCGRGRGRHHCQRDFFGKAKSDDASQKSDEAFAAKEQNAEFLRNIGQTVAAFLDPLASSEDPVSEKNDEVFAAKEQSGEFLRHIGSTVAAFLDPLGISVKVDVEHDGERETCSAFGKENANSKCEVDEKNQPKTVKTENKNKDKKEPSESPKPTDLKTNPPSSKVTTSSTENQNATPKDGSNSDNDLPNGAEGWTVVNPVNQEQSNNDATEEQVNTGVIPKTVNEKKEILEAAKVPLHPNPKIAKALSTMTAMGFDNEGGWLVHLLESKQGNIADVLDTLYPNAGYHGRM